MDIGSYEKYLAFHHFVYLLFHLNVSVVIDLCSVYIRSFAVLDSLICSLHDEVSDTFEDFLHLFFLDLQTGALHLGHKCIRDAFQK